MLIDVDSVNRFHKNAQICIYQIYFSTVEKTTAGGYIHIYIYSYVVRVIVKHSQDHLIQTYNTIDIQRGHHRSLPMLETWETTVAALNIKAIAYVSIKRCVVKLWW